VGADTFTRSFFTTGGGAGFSALAFFGGAAFFSTAGLPESALRSTFPAGRSTGADPTTTWSSRPAIEAAPSPTTAPKVPLSEGLKLKAVSLDAAFAASAALRSWATCRAAAALMARGRAKARAATGASTNGAMPRPTPRGTLALDVETAAGAGGATGAFFPAVTGAAAGGGGRGAEGGAFFPAFPLTGAAGGASFTFVGAGAALTGAGVGSGTGTGTGAVPYGLDWILSADKDTSERGSTRDLEGSEEKPATDPRNRANTTP